MFQFWKTLPVMVAFVVGPIQGKWTRNPCWRPNLDKWPNWTPKPGVDITGCDWYTSDDSTTPNPTTPGVTTTEGSTTSADNSDQSTAPVECTSENEGRCECGNTLDGFHTYTFWQNGVQRCFTIYIANELAGQQLPVVFSPNCYATDKLASMQMSNDEASQNVAAARYGYARIAVSTPDKNWLFGHDTVINDEYPMPCSDEDSKDIAYIRTIFNYLDSRPEQFDVTKVYAEGFSQNSMFSAYIGYCFPDNVRGIYQAGSGLALTWQGMKLPGCQGQVRISDLYNEDVCPFKYNEKRDEWVPDCATCVSIAPCEDCQYFPIYPCYSSQRPMVHCVVEYDNDGISNKFGYSTGTNMYEALENEGHDGRLYRFSPDEDKTIPGSHQDVKNNEYWKVGCMGITDPCSSECENAFIECVDNLNGDNPSALDRTENFAACIDPEIFSGISGCTKECAPTLAMMKASEIPTDAPNSNWGAGSDTAESRPDGSLCTIE